MRVRSIEALVAAVGAVALTAGAAPGVPRVIPRPSTTVVAHDHTPGDGYHLEVDIGRNATRASHVFVYTEKCDATPDFSDVPISRSGVVSFQRGFTTSEGGGPPRSGTLRLRGRFSTPTELRGSWRVVVAGCDTGARAFSARPNEEDHLAHLGGPAPIAAATPKERAQARRLWLASKRWARRLFPRYAVALRRGYRPHPDQCQRATFFHLENAAYRHDRHILDPRHPESLVYSRVPRHAPLLVGYMFRVRRGHEPVFAGPIGNWHTHGRDSTSMMHVWFTNELETAYWRGHEPPVDAIERELIAPLLGPGAQSSSSSPPAAGARCAPSG